MQPLAYRVPFVVDRSRAPFRYYLHNRSPETLEGVRLILLGSGRMLPVNAGRVLPGGITVFSPEGHDLSRTSVVIVRWFRETGEEYLWRVSF